MRTLPTLYLAFALTALAIAPAAAETPVDEAARHETARVAGEAGLKLYSATRWEEAFEAFQRAETAFHAPTLVLFMGDCQRMRNKLVEARALDQQVASQALEPGAPNQFLTAQLLARGEIERIRKRIPVVVFAVKGARADLVQVTVDEARLTISPGAPQEVNPGERTLTATAAGSAPIHRTITLAEGATAEVELAFEPAAPPRERPARAAPRGPRSRGRHAETPLGAQFQGLTRNGDFGQAGHSRRWPESRQAPCAARGSLPRVRAVNRAGIASSSLPGRATSVSSASLPSAAAQPIGPTRSIAERTLKPRIPRKDFVFMISPEGLARRAMLVAEERREEGR